MPDRSSKRPRDLNQLARRLAQESTGEPPPGPAPSEPEIADHVWTLHEIAALLDSN